LYLELPANLSDYSTISLSDSLDSLLRQNFHYDYCRKLGQLAPAQVTLVRRGAETYLAACQSRGQKLGDIKPAVLQKSTGWGEYFVK
ncbi:MAG: GH3 auxin-responsive promoter family protein, partial [Chloroflexota bacterium]